MRRLCLSLLLCGWFTAPIARADEPFTPPPINVPDGFAVQLVAGPPLVKHPMMAGFDDAGRLFVAESAGLNLPADELVKENPNSILLLEDTDGDGTFDKRTVFADKMTLPMGALWHDGALYVAAPPNIWRLEDTDADGVADKREVIVDTFGFSGNAASVHGCFLGPNGRIYWCDGRHGHEFRDGDKITSKGLAARIFSCRPDGSDVQVYCGGGMDNPVEVTFTPEGEMLGTVAIFLSRPQRRDALVHWMYGGVYPHHDALREFPRTGDLLPPLSLFGQVAPSGVMRYRGETLGPEYRDNIFLAQFNTHTIVRTTITRNGSTFTSQDEDFLVSPSSDFHPTDVLEDADGSLLVVDTGGWFRIGCPLSKIAKPNIYGAIYRVTRTGGQVPQDPRGQKIDWANQSPAQLTALLGDPRFAVRDRATAALVQRGDNAVLALKSAFDANSPDFRRRAVWALSRIETETARTALRSALDDPSASVRLAAVRSVGTLRDAGAQAKLQQLVLNDEPPIRREAATALGRVGDPSAIPVLLEALSNPVDRLLEHAIIYALIELNDPQATAVGLTADSTQIRRGALIALDQMPTDELTRDMVTPLLDTGDAALQQTALEIITNHPGWSAEIVGLLGTWLEESDKLDERRSMIRGALLAFLEEDAIQKLVARSLADATAPPQLTLLLLDVIGQAGLPQLPKNWIMPLQGQLHSANPTILQQAVRTVGAVGSNAFDGRLAEISSDRSQQAELRVAALAAKIARQPQITDESFALLLSQLSEDVPPLEQLAAAGVIGQARLNEQQLFKLTQRVGDIGALQLPVLIAAFKGDDHEQVGLALAAALNDAEGAQAISLPQIKEIFAAYPESVQRAIRPLTDALTADAEAQQQKLHDLEASLAAGDAAAGRQVFFGKKAACFACHRVGGEGGLVGPDLSKIGQVRTRRDLLEAIIFPSSSFARGYQPYSILTDDGKVVSGVISRETSDAIFLMTAERAERRIPRAAIDEMVASQTSIMPQGLDRSLTPQELSDLLAFLGSLK